jgi:hypothetical protein
VLEELQFAVERMSVEAEIREIDTENGRAANVRADALVRVSDFVT